jgi:hypothetical protein
VHLTFAELYSAQSSAQRPSLEHIEHCLAYIKEGVICAGDTALEGPGVGGASLQGWNIKHECRAWDGKNGVKETLTRLNRENLKRTRAERAEQRREPDLAWEMIQQKISE